MLGHKISTGTKINTLMCVILVQLYINFYNLQIKSIHNKQLFNNHSQILKNFDIACLLQLFKEMGVVFIFKKIQSVFHCKDDY